MAHTIYREKNMNKLSLAQKHEKLFYLMNSVLDNPKYSNEFIALLKKFNLTRNSVYKEFRSYNIDVYSHNNTIYEDQTIRLVLHIHNLVSGSWHIDRQKAVCDLIKKAKFNKAIDLGFGVPSRYIKDILSSSDAHVTLCDYQLNALDFAKELLNFVG